MNKRIEINKFSKKTGIKVGDIMTRSLITVTPNTSVEECVKKMLENRTGSVLVLDGESHLLGLITKMDILREIPTRKDFSKIKAEEVMTKGVKIIKPDTDLYQALILMKKVKKKKMPVVEGNNIVGMLNAKDIVKIEPQLFEHIAEAINIREESDKLKRLDHIRKHRNSAGIEPRENVEGPCEKCENFGFLEEHDGRMVCGSCR